MMIMFATMPCWTIALYNGNITEDNKSQQEAKVKSLWIISPSLLLLAACPLSAADTKLGFVSNILKNWRMSELTGGEGMRSNIQVLKIIPLMKLITTG